jgi:hypothetical protein
MITCALHIREKAKQSIVPVVAFMKDIAGAAKTTEHNVNSNKLYKKRIFVNGQSGAFFL